MITFHGNHIDVHHADVRVGSISPSGEDEWAAYRCGPHGNVIERRIGTYPTIEAAFKAIQKRACAARPTV